MLYFLHDFFTQLLYWGIAAKKQGRCNWFASFMAMCFYKIKIGLALVLGMVSRYCLEKKSIWV